MSIAPADLLIEPAELAARVDSAQPNLAVIDCRHDLARPQWGAQAYASSHVPGALFAHLDQDLSGPVTPASGRHPLPSVERLEAALGRWGIDRQVEVVAYDQDNSAVAARLWWLLRFLGHPRVAVMNGGFAAWRASGLPVSGEPAVRAPRRFRAAPELAAVVSAAEVASGLERGDIVLVDARSAERFAGRNETLDPVGGHVPGARNHPFTRNLDAHGRFLDPRALAVGWHATLAGAPASAVVAMCGSGVTACHNLLALELAGLPGARLYAGSWSEWIRDPARPVARD